MDKRDKTGGNRSANLLLNPETNMQPDPLLSLENEARELDRAWDRAVRRRDSAAAWRIGERLRAISLAQEAAKPTTALGAAVVLGDAWAILSQKEELSLRDHAIMRRLRPLARRLKRNERRLDDLIVLRGLLEMARAEYELHDPESADVYRFQLAEAPPLIEKALRGAAAPVLASCSTPSASRPG